VQDRLQIALIQGVVFQEFRPLEKLYHLHAISDVLYVTNNHKIALVYINKNSVGLGLAD